MQQLILTKEKTEKVHETFINEVNLALTEQPSSLQMENTYIPELPNATGLYFIARSVYHFDETQITF